MPGLPPCIVGGIVVGTPLSFMVEYSLQRRGRTLVMVSAQMSQIFNHRPDAASSPHLAWTHKRNHRTEHLQPRLPAVNNDASRLLRTYPLLCLLICEVHAHVPHVGQRGGLVRLRAHVHQSIVEQVHAEGGARCHHYVYPKSISRRLAT
jgi:hypothetical protein